MKVGIISKRAHAKGLIERIKGEGWKAVFLGSTDVAIPPSLRVVVMRTKSCSHLASDSAYAWSRGNDENMLIVSNGVTTALSQLKAWERTLNPPQAPTSDWPQRVRPRLADFDVDPPAARKPRRRKIVPPPVPVTPIEEKTMPPISHALTPTQNKVINAVAAGCHTLAAINDVTKQPSRAATHATLMVLMDDGVVSNLRGKGRRGVEAFYATAAQIEAGIDVPPPPAHHRTLAAKRAQKAAPAAAPAPVPTPAPSVTQSTDGEAIASLVWEWMDTNDFIEVIFNSDGSVNAAPRPVTKRTYALRVDSTD